MGLFLQCQGQYGTFLYTDPTDSAASSSTAFATGDGVTTAFTLSRYLGPFLEPVGWVTSLTQVMRQRLGHSGSGWSLTTPNSARTSPRAPAYGRVDRARPSPMPSSAGSTPTIRTSSSSCRTSGGSNYDQVCARCARHENGIDRPRRFSSMLRVRRPTRGSPLRTASPSPCRQAWLVRRLEQRRFPVVYKGVTYFCERSASCKASSTRTSVGLEVDKQQITIAARPTDLVQRRAFPCGSCETAPSTARPSSAIGSS